jgi:hypothetical protein
MKTWRLWTESGFCILVGALVIVMTLGWAVRPFLRPPPSSLAERAGVPGVEWSRAHNIAAYELALGNVVCWGGLGIGFGLGNLLGYRKGRKPPSVQ